MARVGLTYDKVVQIIRDLENRGEKPTINRVREEIGFGSPNTISRFIKMWRKGKSSVTTTPVGELAAKKADVSPQQRSDTVQSVEVIEVATVDAKLPEKTTQKLDAESPTRSDNRPHAKSQGGRRIFNKRNNHHGRRQQNNQGGNQAEPVVNYDMLSLERLEQMSQSELIRHIKRLESILYKEQVRRESCEKMANEASHYAEIIKEQVALRINDLKQSSEVALEQLKLEMQQAREQSEQDLLFYRQQLDKANRKLYPE